MNLTITIGWTLVHFVWQGAGIAALLAAARSGLRKSGAQARYLAAMAAMLLMLASAGATFVYLNSGDIPALQPPAAQSSIAPPAGNVYDPLDAFYLPLAGFGSIARSGPSIVITDGCSPQ